MKIDPLAIVAAVAVLQFLAFVAMSFFSRAKMPKTGLRASERNLLVSAAVALSSGSCATIEAGMSRADVEAKAGRPDEIRNDAETRGPDAVTWVYRGARCAVHLLGEKVEFVE
jgi:hypothetical protein